MRRIRAIVVGVGLGAAAIGWRACNRDPRDSDLVFATLRQRESQDFRWRLRRGDDTPLTWPGLGAAQVSWTWLELLYGLHKPESYEGDFSWLFSKLNTILTVSRRDDIAHVSSLAPFFFVIGHDGAGATLTMNELANRAPKELWRPWFWSAFHAWENLDNPKLAGDLLKRAAENPLTPPYFAALSARLSLGDRFLDSKSRNEALEKELDPVLLKKVQQARPEWFRR